MVAPPLEAGAVNVMPALAFPMVGTPIVGAPGRLAVVPPPEEPSPVEPSELELPQLAVASANAARLEMTMDLLPSILPTTF
jgi:hypothetical protein